MASGPCRLAWQTRLVTELNVSDSVSVSVTPSQLYALVSDVTRMGEWSPICGTSLATPLFAGIVALADQDAGHPLGLINPALYKIEAQHEPGVVDITKGNNSQTVRNGGKTYKVKGFSARGGYDLVTGMGTVDARYFVPELAKLAG